MKRIGFVLGLVGLVGAAAAAAACDSDSDPGASSSGGTSGSSGGTSGNSSGGTSGNSSGGTSGNSSGGTSGGGSSGGIVTTEADKPSIAPCPNNELLTDATKLDALKTAMSTGAISYLDIPYDANDPDILKKKCGLEGFWDPTKHTDAIPVTGTPKLANIIQTQHGGICSENFQSFGTDDGFPVAGVYRKELKATANSVTYHVRARITTSGSASGKKFSDIPLTNADIQSKLVYEVNGTATAHDDLWTGIIGAMAAPAPSVTLDAKNDGTTIFTAKIELICAAQL